MNDELMCEMCGSNMVKKEGGFYICQACGTKFIAKDSQNDGNYQFNGDLDSQELENLYELARRARENGDAEFGYQYYNEILIKVPYDWEAQFYVGYFRAFLVDFLDDNAIDDFCRIIASAVSIVDNLEDVEEKKYAIQLFSSEIYGFVENYYQTYFEQAQYEHDYDGEYLAWYVNSLLELCNLLNYYGDLVENLTDESYQDSLDSWKYSIDLHINLYKFLSFFDKPEHDEYIDIYVEKIHQYDPDYEKPKTKKLFGII